ncbi:D-alanyl-D-alanine carboxypeptidase family protein [Magnetospirillum sp. 64-120]|uniref:D-alanyl-D-alanine carboxypeptidase family protein n=1 Tax=Magnetospirillum sp. 64-120 TaxID=1895778 RepID=UPI000A5E9DBB|nr:D-alanyl-D-alanine carboxypeptidase family protein [Magnetospirillum sp. 64-120]
MRPCFSALVRALPVLTALAAPATAAEAPPPAAITVDAATGAVLEDRQAGQPRHPASLTKMMTLYLGFQAIGQGRASLETPIAVSDKAAGQGGSTLGLKSGATIRLGEALRALVVRSANDAAVAIAEHLAGSEEAFARQMTEQAARLGMTATRFHNATGLTAPGHVTTARDMAVLALALRHDFPQHWPLFAATSMRWGKASLPTVNGFVASYPGAEGLKTGFTCPAGYNLAAAAHRDGRAAIAVVMGATAKDQRLSLASGLMNKAFKAPPGPLLAQTVNLSSAPPDLSAIVCDGRGGGEESATPRLPKGWAIEVAGGRDRAEVKRQLAGKMAELRRALGGGSTAIMIRPTGGALRYRGLIAGLAEDKAVTVCLKLRQEDENNCLVLPPPAVEGAMETERRWRMLSAR